MLSSVTSLLNGHKKENIPKANVNSFVPWQQPIEQILASWVRIT